MVTSKTVPVGRRNIRFRLGVGGCWTADDLESYLSSILSPSGWKVLLRGDHCLDIQRTATEATEAESSRVLEIVPLGNGFNLRSTCGETEELDAVLISPLADGSESRSDDQTRQIQIRRHLARFVRQLKPGGATIFAADDPASEIFCAIRLDCQRLGYALSGAQAAYRIVRCDRPEPMPRNLLKYISPAGDADWPIVYESGDQLRKALAALITVNLLGVMPVTQAILNLSTNFDKTRIASGMRV